jgi:hypothetical protein
MLAMGRQNKLFLKKYCITRIVNYSKKVLLRVCRHSRTFYYQDRSLTLLSANTIKLFTVVNNTLMW